MPIRLKSLLEQSLLKSKTQLSAEEPFGYLGLTDDQIERLQTESRMALRGKVRDLILELDHITLIHSDRLSAFDRYIGSVPGKGIVLTELTEFWLKKSPVKVPAYSFVRQNLRTLRGERMAPLKCEVIVRGYVAGSILRAYEKGVRVVSDVVLEDGLLPYGALSQPIVTLSTKAEGVQHDAEMTPDQMIENGICSRSEWLSMREMALELYDYGQSHCRSKGWILADTKYEFGRDMKGKIRVIDEVHTPDSSRIWRLNTYQERMSQGRLPEMFDKETVRQELLALGYSGNGKPPVIQRETLIKLCLNYLEVCESLTGREIGLEPEDLNMMDIAFLR